MYPKDGNNGTTPSTGTYQEYVLAYDQSKLPHHKAKVFEEPQLVELGRLINLGSGLFSRVLLIDGTYYAFVSKPGGIYHVRGYDADWQFTGFEKNLTPEGESDIDEDIAFDGEYIYQYCMVRPGSGGKIRKFDKDFNLVKQTDIFTGEPNDIILDQNIKVINGKVYAGSEYRENNALWRQMSTLQNIPPNAKVTRAMHLRVFDTDLNLLEEQNLIANISGAVVPNQYWALGASQLYANGYYCIVAHSAIGNISYFDRGESIGARQLFILRFDDDFNFVDSKGPLTDTSNDNYWCTGSWYDDGRYYLSYTCLRPGEGGVLGPGVPKEGGTFREDQGNIRLSIFDDDFNELETIDITNLTITPGAVIGAAHRSKMFKVSNKLYVAYDNVGQALIQEVILKEP